MRRMVVVHPHLSVFGGSEELTRMLLNELVKRGVEVKVVTAELDEERFPKHRLIEYVFIRRRFAEDGGAERFYELAKTLQDIVEKFQPDVVLSMLQEPAYIAAVKIFRPEIATAMYIHFPIEEEVSEENRRIFYSMYRFMSFSHRLYYLADLRMVNSLYSARVLYQLFGVDANVVYPSIDWIYIENEIEDLNIKEPTIISVGRFVKQKRFELLIKIFKDYVKKEVPEARLVIAGTEDPRFREYFEYVRAMAETVKDVEIVIRPSYSQLLKLYQISKVYAHLREGEHFGMAPLEAMAQGAATVVTKTSGITEVFERDRELITFSDIEDLGKTLVHALRLPKDTLLKMYRSVRSKIGFFSPSRFASEVINYCRAIVEKKSFSSM